MTIDQILEILNEAFAIPEESPWVEADIAVALKLCLRDLSSQDLLIKSTDGDDEVTDETVYISAPAQFKAVKVLTLTDSSDNPLEPLILMEGGIQGYREEMSLSDSRSEPMYYAVSERLIYPYPAPNATYPYLLQYYANHLWAASGSDITIEFSDDFLFCIAAGTAYMKGRLKNSYRKYIENWGPIYFDERQRMRGLV